jgi:hypothetical protein
MGRQARRRREQRAQRGQRAQREGAGAGVYWAKPLQRVEPEALGQRVRLPVAWFSGPDGRLMELHEDGTATPASD